MTTKYRASVAIAALMTLSACGIFKGGPKKTPTVGERIPILVSENGIQADKTIADIQVTLPAPAANDSWTQSGGNSAKSMGQLALGA
ncbi:MAG TPA: pyrrolo-quinoline quinone, partial [Sphingomonas sp.]|nr:pyrrolo-quinoline quinone [Sphingomonas sp.]